jgi:uncharacterized phage protein (TIGR01671 family)
MREILFRGKRCDNGEWVQGYYIRAEHHWHKHGIHKDWIICGASANGGWFALHNKYAVKAETVSEFSGLTDKNGKKIFEGDILKTIIGNGVVNYVAGCFCVRYSGGNNPAIDIVMNDADVEVIGNIHLPDGYSFAVLHNYNKEFKSQWIPVTERLPEDYEIVLCYDGSHVEPSTFFGGEFYDMESYDSHVLFGITHWMPLPEPPKGE